MRLGAGRYLVAGCSVRVVHDARGPLFVLLLPAKRCVSFTHRSTRIVGERCMYLVGEVALDQQVSHLQEGGLLRQLLDRVATVPARHEHENDTGDERTCA